ncbi:AhpA/YtjB family protein [Oceanimonas marisflavi]|uniref:AhpA/YtjB family protein n=1 Tax=Oceanimonas marisflavi TaxID=2059724 RepID=UPI000D312877|nr:AhpA/YtjB family protein [Oceanimonas marisflavi]
MENPQSRLKRLPWLWPLALLLLLLAGHQWLALNDLNQRWHQLPHRTSATALADFAEFQALRALNAEDSEAQQLLVTELTHSPLVLSARLYDGGGTLLAAADTPDAALGQAYVRPLFAEERPAGFLHLSLAESIMTGEQHQIRQRLYYHLSWLLPLTGAMGALLAAALLRLRRRAL